MWCLALALALLPLRDRERRADQAHVRERLWEVAERIAAPGIGFFSEEAQVITVRQQPLERLVRLLDAAATERKVFHRPESADAEGSLRRLSRIAVEQSAAGIELTAERRVGRAHAVGIRRLEAIPGDAKQASVYVSAVEG